MDNEFVQFSLTPLLIGTFAAIACALPGNFLILRRQALIGDAISHVVLPGIVVAFLITGTVDRDPDASRCGRRSYRRRHPDRGHQASRADRARSRDGRRLHVAVRSRCICLLEQSDTSSRAP